MESGLVATLLLLALLLLGKATGTTASVVVSGSMEPGMRRGDVLIIRAPRKDDIRAGDIVLFSTELHAVPIVHRRVIELHERHDGARQILTKDDKNPVTDRSFLYTGQWLHDDRILGRAIGYLP
ncbi:hypothetical protein E2562_024600 [Oryza meyeriana var. granulata]|uniref:Signal peptidase complex catalytic subunit SEC11 n=1 Tax=Oryza meyeriana var. granulata TaxID=110450 RepID=A0A6G1DM69_9ORYZ|nr:hypothetical protein E2562_024600 [Oryza meyeriana var. granulata]